MRQKLLRILPLQTPLVLVSLASLLTRAACSPKAGNGTAPVAASGENKRLPGIS